MSNQRARTATSTLPLTLADLSGLLVPRNALCRHIYISFFIYGGDLVHKKSLSLSTFYTLKRHFRVKETLLWHFNFPLAKLLMFPHALIKSWCKPCTTETWLWYHLPLTGCQVWIMSWRVRGCIIHLSKAVNSGWPRAWSPVQSRHTSCLRGSLCGLSSSGSCC